MIKEFKDEIEGFKNILTEIKKTPELLREQGINEIKNETKIKLNIYGNGLNNILGKLYVDLATLRLKCDFFEKPYEYDYIKKKGKLRILARK